jgi:hypothetical protein
VVTLEVNDRPQGVPDTMGGLNLLQRPAMAMSVAASWLVGSSHQARRCAGFSVFLLSNAPWVLWGLYGSAPALIALQVALTAMNIRGAMKTDKAA